MNKMTTDLLSTSSGLQGEARLRNNDHSVIGIEFAVCVTIARDTEDIAVGAVRG